VNLENSFSKIKVPFSRSEEEIMSDFKLMFSNCRLYNEEGSTIYEVRLFMLLAVFSIRFLFKKSPVGVSAFHFSANVSVVVQFSFGIPFQGCRVINITAYRTESIRL
jgi:hypothetical protein